LILGIDLSSQETLLKYIGGFHSYLRHKILMFNPTNIDEVCVQETHLEARGRNEPQEGSKKPFVKGDKGKRKFNLEMEEIMLHSRKREKNSHVNIVQKMAMMKTIIGNLILK
jgi:hypothetical protein